MPRRPDRRIGDGSAPVHAFLQGAQRAAASLKALLRSLTSIRSLASMKRRGRAPSGLIVMFFVAIVFVLLPLLVLLVFLLALAIGVIFVAEHEGVAIHFVQHGAFEHLHRLAFGCVALAGFLVIFPGL